MGFSAYGITQGDDPVAQAMKGLIDNAAGHEHQIALLWQAVVQLSDQLKKDCVPCDAQQDEAFDAESLSRLVK
jgi:serine O-acetyltransferase